MKKCPYCNEQIQDLAKKCRFCGKWLEQNTIENSKNNMENQPAKLDKALRNIIIAGVIIIVSSIVYYCVYLPLKREYVIKKCSKESTVKTLDDRVANKKDGSGNSLDESIYNKCLGDRGLTR